MLLDGGLRTFEHDRKATPREDIVACLRMASLCIEGRSKWTVQSRNWRAV